MREPGATGDAVAIVGMAAVFPGAADLDAYWANLAGGVDAITEVPPTRWDPVFYDPAAAATDPDRFYCRRGGFVDADAVFDPVAFGIMPVAARGAEPDQLLALGVAARALADAGYGVGHEVPRDRAGVILGRGGYLTPGMARLADRVRTPQQLITTLAELVPGLDAETLARIRAAFLARRDDLGPDTAIGLVPNLAASRIANRLDLRGPAYTVDAACASSLLAVDQGCRELRDRRCDVVVAGGVHVCHDVTFWSVFTQLGALSHSEAIRPFDRRADGILIGEGAGLVVLKRLADAERDGDRVYAVIRGVGVSSDGRDASPMRPRLEGQRAALAAAWQAAGVDAAAVGLVEAHGTGTPAGDEVELEAL
ncbi:MAG: polyketide synthase, partial [Myxococcales bacterium]|nr:polyketide synthase [Myxococcales bacterium]